MKKYLVLLFVLVFSITLVGCGKESKKATLNVSYDGVSHITNVKEGSTLKYTLMYEEYEFKIVDISDTEIKMEVNKYGLTSGNWGESEKEFIIKNGEKLVLTTQTTDVIDTISFSY